MLTILSTTFNSLPLKNGETRHTELTKKKTQQRQNKTNVSLLVSDGGTVACREETVTAAGVFFFFGGGSKYFKKTYKTLLCSGAHSKCTLVKDDCLEGKM